MTVLFQLDGQSKGLTSKNSTLQYVHFFSEEQACSMSGNAFVGMISITGFESPNAPLQDGWGSVLRLNFDDVEKEWQGYFPMTEKQADSIIDWLIVHEDILKGVYVHCAAGESRSAAVARFIGDTYGLLVDSQKSKNYNRHVYATLRKQLEKRVV